MPETPQTLCEAIVAQAADAIIYADTRGAVQVWNEAAETLFGFTASEVRGQSLDLIIPEHLRERHWSAFDRALETGRTKYAGKAMVTRATHKSGARLYVNLSFALVKDEAGQVVGSVAIGRDVTAEREAQRTAKVGV